MLMTEDTRNALNDLVAACFDMNAFCDNLTYNLGAYDYKQIENILHERVAHSYPVLSDTITDMMLSLDARPVRNGIPTYDKDYRGNIVELFDDHERKTNEFRDKIVRTLELAELNGDTEVKLALEDFLEDFVPYRKQAEIWARYAHRYEGNEKSFEQRFDKITTVLGNAEDDDD